MKRTEMGYANRGRKKLTKRLVDSLQPRDTDYVVMDSEVTGFGVRVLPSGNRFYFAQYRLPGAGRGQAARRLKIGTVGILTVDEARREAKGHLGSVAKGADPFFERKERNSEATVRVVAESFLANRKLHQKPRTVAEYKRLIDATILPRFGTHMLRTISRKDVLDLQARLAKTPAVANNMVAILGAMFNYAVDAELYTGANPCARIKKLPLRSRKKSLKREEYAALGKALDRALTDGLPVPEKLRDQSRGMSGARRAKLTGRKRGPYKRKGSPVPRTANPVTVTVLRFLALSGWREGEALALRWDAIDFERGVAVLADSKTGRSVRPLGAAALNLLRGLQREKDSPFVFPGLRPGTHLQDAKRVWIAAKEVAGLECRLHDLRHSFTTVGREQGYSDYIIAKLVGHTIDTMTARYGDVPEDTVKRAADVIAETIDRRLAGGVRISAVDC